MICPYCNSQLSNDTKFCPYCDADLSFSMNFGTDISETPAAAPPQQPEPVQQPPQTPQMPDAFQQSFPQNGMQQGFPQNGMQQSFPQNGMQQGFPQNGMQQGFPQGGMQQGFPQGGMQQGFPQGGMQQGFPQNGMQQVPPAGPMPFQGPPKSSAKKWVIPAVIGVLVAAGVAVGIALKSKTDTKSNTSTAESVSSAAEGSSVLVSEPESSSEPDLSSADDSSVAEPSSSSVPVDPEAVSDSAEWLDYYYLPKGIYFGMSSDEANDVMLNSYSPVNREPYISSASDDTPIYEYYFTGPPAELGEFGNILAGTTVSIELFFDEDDSLIQCDVWTDAEYDAEEKIGVYGGTLTDTLRYYNALQLGVKGFTGGSDYDPYPFGEDNGNYHTHTYINDDSDRALRINYTEIDEGYYCAYYSYF